MTLREEMELIRGVPIECQQVRGEDVPCIETSDTKRLCKNPVVSVCMITYNHEPYIRKAIESVICQKVDFEFELVIGEDCSSDNTRDICLEYQKKYPDRIRVLWWHQNVSRLGGNGRRTRAHCRGEYIAYCEGDDYWVDTYKLQKQVNVMRKYPTVSFCFGDVAHLIQDRKEILHPRRLHNSFKAGLMDGRQYATLNRHAVTCAVLVRTSSWETVTNKYEIFNWKLAMGDVQLWMALALEGDVYFIDEELATYRIHRGGVSHGRGSETTRDGCLMLLYFNRLYGLFQIEKIVAWYNSVTWNQLKTIAAHKSRRERKRLLSALCNCSIIKTKPRVAFCDRLFAMLGYLPFMIYSRIKSRV